MFCRNLNYLFCNISESKGIDILKMGIQGVKFKNWSQTYSCIPELFFAPKSIEEIREILKLSRDKNKKIKVVGCGHSPSDIACTNDYMISLQNFNQLVKVNNEKKQVTVQAGMILSELNEMLHLHNMALPVLGSISNITIGGAISTGTHGTGINYGIMSSYVVELELMLANGTIKTCSPNENLDIFLASLCSLGSLGIILTLTLQCEPAFNLELRQYGLELKHVIENLDVHLSASDHFRFMWFPHTDNVIVSHSSRTDQPVKKEMKIQNILRWFWEYGIGYYALEFLYYLSTFYPFIVPYINRLYFHILSSSTSRIDRSDKILNFECLFKQYVNEWAIPLEKIGLVLWQLKEWIESTPNIYVHFPVEVRFTKGDNILISPANGRDTCYINIIMYRPYGKDVPFLNYWASFETIMKKEGGRPHWAKAHSITAESFVKMYPTFRKWCIIRQELDPHNRFINQYMERILQID